MKPLKSVKWDFFLLCRQEVKKKEEKKNPNKLTTDSTVAGPLERNRKVCLPVPMLPDFLLEPGGPIWAGKKKKKKKKN